MDAGEQRAFLEAIARELAAAIAVLPRGDARIEGALSELAEARVAVERAAEQSAKAPHAEPDEVLCEAWRMRAEAIHEREAAEARLQALRAECAAVLAQLEERQGVQMALLDERQEAQASLDGRESELLAECESLEKQVKVAQSFLQRLSDQVVDRGHLGVQLNRRRRAVQHTHDISVAKSETSRAILELHENTATHVRQVSATCVELEQAAAAAHEESRQRTAQLRSEWAEQKLHFQRQEDELEAKLAELHSEYAERWNAVEKDSRVCAHEKVQRAAEAEAALEQELAKLDLEREREAVRRRETLEEQKERVAEARAAVLAEMEAKLTERQQHIQGQVESERQRCSRLRGKQQRRIDDLAREVQETRGNIAKVRENYHAQRTRSPELHLPAINPEQGLLYSARQRPFTGLRAA